MKRDDENMLRLSLAIYHGVPMVTQAQFLLDVNRLFNCRGTHCGFHSSRLQQT